MKKKLLFAINVDWYFDLHWKERIFSEMTNDFDVKVCYSLTHKSDEGQLPVGDLIPLSIRRSNIDPFSNLLSLLKANRILLRHSFDLLHTVTIKPNIYFGILSRLYSKPILMTIPGLGTVFSSGGMKYRIMQKLICALYKFIGKNRKKAYFVFENRQDRELFLKNNICTEKNSIAVSGAGVDLEKFKFCEETEAATGVVKILFAARLLEGKGLEDLIIASNRINKTGKRVEVYVAGITDTDTRGAIPVKKIKNWNKTGQIKYLGRVQDMTKLLSEIHVVALPTSYGEGLPRVLVEANACGRPVITTNIAGCNDFVIDGLNGILIQPGNVDELVGAIESLRKPDIRRRMGRAGRERVEKGYSNELIIGQYKDIYTLFK